MSISTKPVYSDFYRFFPPNEDDIVKALKEGLVVIDANILLNLYKQRRTATSLWLKVLSRFGNRLFIPYQVQEEFWRVRDSLIARAGEADNAAKNIRTQRDEICNVFKEWNRKSGGGTHLDADNQEKLDALHDVVEGLTSVIEKHKDEHEQRFSLDPRSDEIASGLETLARGGAIFGEPFTKEEESEYKKIAEERFEEEIPPGFKDASKSSNPEGDYFLWQQVLNFVSTGNCDYPYVTFITADLKSDWWGTVLDPDAPNRGKKIAHPALVEEMREWGNSHYLQLQGFQLLESAREALNIDVNDEIIKNAQINDEQDDLGEFVISIRGTEIASATINQSGSTRVHEGSKVRVENAASMPSSLVKKKNEFIDSGVLVELDEEEYLEFSCDYEFTSSSTPASLILGGNRSGNVTWKNQEGVLLGTVLDDLSDK